MPAIKRVFIILALLSTAGCKRPAVTPGPGSVSVITLSTQPVTLTTELPGRVTALRIAEVRPQAGGVILKRLFTEGTDVQAGSPLYQIDPASYRAAVESAQAAVEKDSATLVSATALMDRYQLLVKDNAVSKQDYDNAVAAQGSAAADLDAARAALRTALINLQYTDVLAPISGRISRSAVTEGALVTPGQPLALATIQQLDPIYVDVTQPSTLLLRLKREYAQGRLTSAGRNRAEVRLTLEDGTNYDLPGKLEFAEVTVDPGTGAITLRAVFPNPQNTLLPGMFVQERIQEGLDKEALLVPQRGVTHNQRGEPTALVVGRDNKVEARQLTTDRAIGDMWLVTGGLNAGDRLIVEGLQKAVPGTAVRPVEVSTADWSAPAGRVQAARLR